MQLLLMQLLQLQLLLHEILIHPFEHQWFRLVTQTSPPRTASYTRFVRRQPKCWRPFLDVWQR